MRIFITILLGLITPYLFYFIFTFLLDVPPSWPQKIEVVFFDISAVQEFYISETIWIVFFVLVVVFSFFELFGWLYKKSIKSRRTFMTIVWYFIIGVSIAIFSAWEYWYFPLIPLAIIIGNYFVYTNFINSILIYVLFSVTSKRDPVISLLVKKVSDKPEMMAAIPMFK